MGGVGTFRGTGRRGRLHARSAAGLASNCPVIAKCTPSAGRRPRSDLLIFSAHTVALCSALSDGLLRANCSDISALTGRMSGNLGPSSRLEGGGQFLRPPNVAPPPPGWARLEVGCPGPASVPEPPGVGVCSLQGLMLVAEDGWGQASQSPAAPRNHRAQGQPR